MDHQFCPGAKTLRQPQPEMFDCPACGQEVEIWTDEIRGVCSSCGKAVFRDGYMSCLEWCKFGQDCVGEEAYGRFVKNRAVGLRRKLLEAVHKHWHRDPERIRQAEAVLFRSEELLKEESADWHIVIPASILHNIRDGSLSDGLKAAREILLRSGLMTEEIEKICRIIEHDPAEDSIEAAVVRDAAVLAGSEAQSAPADRLRTDTAKRLAGVSASGG